MASVRKCCDFYRGCSGREAASSIRRSMSAASVWSICYKGAPMKLLRRFLTLGIGASEGTVSGYRRPLGYQQILAATLASATHLTLPTLPNGMLVGYVVIQCEGAASATVRWRDDGTAPTSTVGMILDGGQELAYTGDPTMIPFIVDAGSPILNISYYA